MSDEGELHTALNEPGASTRMIEAWGEAIERKDPGTWSHCKRVAVFVKILAQVLGLDNKEIRVIADGALLHEIGRLAIPDSILRKPAKLTAKEMLVMRESPSRGYEMLRNVPSYAGAAEIVYAQREWFDGTGYPRGLTRAAFLSARNDAFANVAIIGAGLTTIYVRSAWPDLIVGMGIALMNSDAAREIYMTARTEHRTAVPQISPRVRPPGNFPIRPSTKLYNLAHSHRRAVVREGARSWVFPTALCSWNLTNRNRQRQLGDSGSLGEYLQLVRLHFS